MINTIILIGIVLVLFVIFRWALNRWFLRGLERAAKEDLKEWY